MKSGFSNGEKWVRADMAIKLIDDLVAKGGESEDTIKDQSRYDKTREAWIAAVFSLVRSSQDNLVWYLRENDLQDSETDIFALPLDLSGQVPSSPGQANIQVTRITEYSNPDIMLALKKKFISDLSGTNLVCYIMRDQKVMWNDIHQEILKISPKAGDVTILGNIAARRFIVGKVYPALDVREINLDSIVLPDCSKMIEATLVTKEEDAGIEHIGTALLTPEFKILDV